MNSSTFIRKNFRRTALASIVALGAFGTSNSFAAEATTSATGTVIVPIEIANEFDLSFGKFAPGAGGSVTIDTAGSRTGDGVILSSVDSSPAAAKFNVSGDNNATYGITWGGVDVMSETGEPTNTMALATFSDFTGGGGTTGDVALEGGTLSDTGAQSIYLGGTLTVGANQAAGDYTGDVSVTVEYN